MIGPDEVLQWALTETRDGERLIVIVIDDDHDDEIAAAVASERLAPSPRFGGRWGSRRRDQRYAVVFSLTENACHPQSITRRYWTTNLHRPLLEAIVDVPHLVALLPREFAGDLRTLPDLALRLTAALFIRVENPSPQAQHILDVQVQRAAQSPA